MIVYMIQCRQNGRRYIGRTSRNLRVRFFEHLRDARNRPESTFDDDLVKYGLDGFDIRVMKECDDKQQMMEAEQKLIQSLEPEYNQSMSCAGGLSWAHTRVTRKRPKYQKRKISEGLKRSWQLGLRTITI